MLTLSNTQEKALRVLAQYKFLTMSQFVDLLGFHKDWIRKEIEPYKKRGMIKSIRYALAPKQGTNESLYYLTAKGVVFISENLEIDFHSIKYPIGEVSVRNDFFHRFWTVNTLISVNRFIENNDGELYKSLVYFDKSGSQRKSNLEVSTRLNYGEGKYINCDLLASFRTSRKHYVCVIEIYNGKDTKRIVEQTAKVLQAIYEGATAQKLDVQISARLLLVFENESILKACMQRLQAGLTEFEDPQSTVFLKTSEEVKKNFESGWIDLYGFTRNLNDN